MHHPLIAALLTLLAGRQATPTVRSSPCIVQLSHVPVDEVIPVMEDILVGAVCTRGSIHGPPPPPPPPPPLFEAVPGTNALVIHLSGDDLLTALQLLQQLDVPQEPIR